MNKVIAGIDIGGTKIAIALETLEGEKVAVNRISTQVELGPFQIVENISKEIEEMIKETPADLVSIGIGCPGPLDMEKGLILSPTNLPNWDEFPLVEIIKKCFKVPTVLDNDANTATLGEYIYGAGRGFTNLIYITVSTGIGGGIVINGELIHGVGAGAGELGHTIVLPNGIPCKCGSVGCLETICSGVNIARRATDRLAKGEPSLLRKMSGDSHEVTTEMVVEAVRQGDQLASEIWAETCHFLAIGIGNMITLLAPEAVIIGGGVAMAGELLLKPLRSLLKQYVTMVPMEKVAILQATLGSESGVCGALVIAKQAYSNHFQAHAK
jgi:glucokinase